MTPCDQQPGKIIAVQDGKVAVLTHARGGCGRCRQPGGCGRPMDDRPNTTWMVNHEGFDVGEDVFLNVATPALEKAAWSAYGVPLLAMIAGAGLGSLFGEGWSVGFALAGLWVALGWVRWRSHKLAPTIWLSRTAETE